MMAPKFATASDIRSLIGQTTGSSSLRTAQPTANPDLRFAPLLFSNVLLDSKIGFLVPLEEVFAPRTSPQPKADEQKPDGAEQATVGLLRDEFALLWTVLHMLQGNVESRYLTSTRRTVQSVIRDWAEGLNTSLNHKTVRRHLDDARDYVGGRNPSIPARSIYSLKNRRNTLWLIITAIMDGMYGYDARKAEELPPDFRALIKKNSKLRIKDVHMRLREAARHAHSSCEEQQGDA